MFDKEEIFFGADGEIRSFLCDELKNIPVSVLSQTGSTNDDMKQAARQGAEEFSLLVADSQTKGKGRQGRSFFSPDGTGCYMSFVLRPCCSAYESTILTTLAVTAAANATQRVTGIKTGIKWVNDIFLEGKKVGGILTEGSLSADRKSLEWAVIGIGINLAEPKNSFPEEIMAIAGSLGQMADTRLRNRLAAEILNEFYALYKKSDRGDVIDAYKKRLFFLGKEITFVRDGAEFTATATDIDDMCHLIVTFSDGRKEVLSSGEIRLVGYAL